MTAIRLEKLLRLGNDSQLQQLVRKAETMERLSAGLKAGLSTEYAAHLVSASLRRDGSLVVVADSPAWAARLRFEAENLLAIARNSGAEVNSCRVIVAKEQAGT